MGTRWFFMGDRLRSVSTGGCNPTNELLIPF